MGLNILPKPKKLVMHKGFYYMDFDSKIFISRETWDVVRDSVLFFKKRMHQEVGISPEVIVGKSDRYNGIYLKQCENINKQSYQLLINNGGVFVEAFDRDGFHYALMSLLQIIKLEGLRLPQLQIEDDPHFKHRGFYYDVTRGKVPKKSTIFEMIDLLSEYKINEFQLYIEHTYLWEGFSEVFRDKDVLSAQDILDIDDYAYQRNIELIPSIATFGHMYEILESKTFRHLSEKPVDDSIPFSFVNRMAHHTIDVSKEESIELVRFMIESYLPLFRSQRFNICADETFDLGKYANRELAEEVGVGRLYVDFLKKIISIVEENGSKVLFWGDIILKYPELLHELSDDITCLNWGYKANEDEKNTRIISESGIPQYVCPSTTGWNRMINWYDNSSENIRTMINHAVNYDAYGILLTDWGDHGHVNLWGSSIPMVIYGAHLSWNPNSMNSDDVDDKLISGSYYGKDNKDLVSLLREISRNQIGNWSYINFILEKEYGNSNVINMFMSEMKKLNYEEIYRSVLRLDSLRNDLLVYGNRIRDKKSFYEFVVMTDLMSLTQEAFLYLMKYELKVSEVKTTRDAWEIAEDIEYAVEHYKKAWRMRNRESELVRVTSVFYEIADKLRNYGV